MFIATAHAQTAVATPAAGFDFMSLLPLAAVLVLMYFLMIRPQQKKQQQQRDMLSNLHRGDHVVTYGGIMGTITKVVNEQEVELEIASDVTVRLARSGVADVVAKTVPANSASSKAAAATKAAKAAKVVKSVSRKSDK